MVWLTFPQEHRVVFVLFVFCNPFVIFEAMNRIVWMNCYDLSFEDADGAAMLYLYLYYLFLYLYSSSNLVFEDADGAAMIWVMKGSLYFRGRGTSLDVTDTPTINKKRKRQKEKKDKR